VSTEPWSLEPWRLFLVLVGPFVGTLAATWAVAWPRLPRPLAGGSRCSRCGAQVPLWRQVPLLSWASSKGDRGCCDGRIPWSYPLGETAGLLVGLISGLLAVDWVEGTLRLLLGVTLIYASLVDLRRYVIPVQAIIVVAVLGVTGHTAARDWAGLVEGAAAAVVTLAAFEALRRLSARTRVDPGLGLGDGLMAAGLAVWLGQSAALMAVIAAGGAILTQMTALRRAISPFSWALSCAALILLALADSRGHV
jgi:prepilin signal peptidase PulO-like enzyme (type II secretory pathway)